jgi:hypothetical protein
MLLTNHAWKRASQRNFSEDDMEFIVQYGECIRRAGAVFFRMRHKDVPKDLRNDDTISNLVGATVVVCKCSQVILTVYYASNFRKILRKAKYGRQPQDTIECPCCQQECAVA